MENFLSKLMVNTIALFLFALPAFMICVEMPLEVPQELCDSSSNASCTEKATVFSADTTQPTGQAGMIKSILSFRPIEEADFPLLYQWVHTPHVKKWWYPDALEWDLFVEKYRKKLHSDSQWGFIVYCGIHPIGYIQYYDASKIADAFGNCDPVGTYGMDLYIGDLEFIGKGYGTQILREFMKKITEERSVTKFVIDPHAANRAAIKTYEKVGFKRLYEVDQPLYGRILLMELEL